MAATFPNLLADGITDEDDFLPYELFAGEAPVTTAPFENGSGDDIAQFAVVVMKTDGTIDVWSGTNYPGDAAATVVPVPFGIVAQGVADGEMCPVYTSGFFNHAALVWPGGVSTLVNRKRAFIGTNIQIGELKGSTGRIALPAVT